MGPDDIRAKLDTRPFQPFRIHLSDGAAFEVRHPELAIVSKRELVVGVPPSKEARVADHLVYLSLMHITRIEPIQTNGNRSSRKRSA